MNDVMKVLQWEECKEIADGLGFDVDLCDDLFSVVPEDREHGDFYSTSSLASLYAFLDGFDTAKRALAKP